MKETKKQIKAQLINEVKKQYECKIKDLQDSRDYWRKHCTEALSEQSKLIKQKQELENKNLELKDKILQYEEWIERMQDFCNLPESERKSAFKIYIDEIAAKAEHERSMLETISVFNNISSLLFC